MQINNIRSQRMFQLQKIIQSYEIQVTIRSLENCEFSAFSCYRLSSSQYPYDYITEIVYLNAHPDQRVQIENSPQAKLIEEFRLAIYYIGILSKDFYLWAHFLNTTRNMISQIQHLLKTLRLKSIFNY